MTAAEIQTSIAKLEKALAHGELSVQFSDRQVTYKSTSQLVDAIAYFRGLLNEQSGRGRQSFGVATKGF